MKKPLWCMVILLSVFWAGTVTGSAATIEFWTTETQSDRMKTIQLLMDTFEALNSDVSVRLVPIEENDMPSQMAAASAAGNLPGLIEGSSELMLAFGEESILDIKSTSEMVRKIGKDRFYQGPLKMVETTTPLRGTPLRY